MSNFPPIQEPDPRTRSERVHDGINTGMFALIGVIGAGAAVNEAILREFVAAGAILAGTAALTEVGFHPIRDYLARRTEAEGTSFTREFTLVPSKVPTPVEGQLRIYDVETRIPAFRPRRRLRAVSGQSQPLEADAHVRPHLTVARSAGEQ